MGNKAKIVRISGIEEWYAPTYNSPVMEENGLYDLFSKIGLPYVYGPCIREDERLADDLLCIIDRLCGSIQTEDSDRVYDSVLEALKDGKERVVNVGNERIVITPYSEVPKLSDSAFSEFGEYADIMKERYLAI